MRLESITLHGFKSFAERTEVKVLPGITCVVGPNGTGKCVSGETPVILGDGRVVAIRTLVESALAAGGPVREFDDGVAALASGPGVDVLSLDPVTLKLERRPVDAFIRRTAPPFLLRVRTRSGREITTTHYHPFFGLEGGALKTLTAETLGPGVRIAVPRRLPVKAAPGPSLADEIRAAFTPDDPVFGPQLPALEWRLEDAAERAGGRPALAAAVRIGVPTELDGRLARFLGYLVAEGRVTPANQVWFVSRDEAATAGFCRLAGELFGVEPRRLAYRPGVTGAIVVSRALCLLLDRVVGLRVGAGSAERAVPPPVWTAPDEVVAEFLSGLFEGRAYIRRVTTPTGRAGPCVEYVTASRRLADEVATLLLRLGLLPRIRRKVKHASSTAAGRRRPYYGVSLCGVQQLRRLAGLVRFGAQQRRLEEALGGDVPPNPHLDLVPDVRPLLRAAVAAAGLPQLRRLRARADSDVYWDEVVAVERVTPADPWVYDLTVADTHNFVAANVIVHNSNISDAVRWALGEQSAKSLRGQRMEDVIFHGSASRRPVGLAEVELLFANDGALPVAWSQVAVARRLYRTGESEYLLNGQPTRLRDILDLFAGTGANPRAYSVMDQDRLNHVLTARPPERRVFIEEAAGIARYKQQRSETQGKLEAARQNLLRVRDVMDEVRRQLGALERQAKKAQQYKGLAEERREVALRLAAADHAALEAEEARLAAEIADLRDREQARRTELAGLAGQEAAHRQALQESEHRLSDLRQALQKVQAELERLLERREQMGIQLRETTEELTRLADEARLGAERLAALAGEREGARAALAEAERLAAEQAGAAAALEDEVERHRAALGEQRERLEALRVEQVQLAAERTELTRAAGELRERESQLRRRAERLAAEQAEVEGEAARLAAARAALERARAEAEAHLAALGTERGRVQAALDDVERRLAEAQTALAGARLALAARESSLEALRQLERAREGYGSGVRALFGAGRRELAGVLGTVADLIEVPSELERAVAAVLGERLEWVVVERFAHARQALAWLQARNAGTATFVPLDTLPPPAPPPEGPEVAWLAPRLRACSPALLHELLGRVALVEHLDRAEALWRRNGLVATYVTPAGEVLGPTGRLRGGGDDGRGESSLLARKRQIRELEEDVRRLEGEVAAAQGTVGALEAEAAGLRARLARVEGDIHAAEAARLAGDKDLEQAARDHERLGRHAETIALEARQVAEEIAATLATLGRLEPRIATTREAEATREATIASLREAIEAAQARETELVASLTASRVELASGRERAEALGRELARLDQIEAELRERLAQAEARRAQLTERQAALAEERERTDAAARDVAVERDRAEAAVRQVGQEHEALREALAAVEQQARGLEHELRGLVGAVHDRELRATEHRVRREELAQEVQRGLGADVATLRARHEAGRDLPALRARLAELDERLAAVGAVNLVADEEYRELDERLTFLRTQHDDLVASIKDLEKALRGMTRTAQERFLHAFEQINRDFGRIFERLFEGGRAELRLVEPEDGDDPLETGVELMAQPRGKRLQSVTLLSGGERALTGLALLFAIFYYRPSPFCILDEVDAPLDDANIHRFLRVLRELTERTQFLVITHNRKTMEAADVLYGVTMEEPGLSKLVAVKLNA